MTQLTLKGDQPAALDHIMRWWETPANRRNQIFRLYGGAGVGKTHIAHVLENYAKVHYMTLSGKAALVMRSKGCAGATTCHSAMYRLEDDFGGEPTFVLNEDSELIRNADLLVVDELGMIGTELGEDMASFGKPILALGDLNQLPPPNNQPSYFLGRPADFTMREILRQAKDSPIIELAYQALETGRLKVGKYGTSQVFSDSVKASVMKEAMLAADQILCGRNQTRTRNNAVMRDWKGLVGDQATFLPTVGERLVCLRNNHKKGILNGEQFRVEEILLKDMGKVFCFTAVSLDSGSDRLIEFEVPWNYFAGTADQLPQWEKANYDNMDYADVMTTHKFQGSQANSVAILDESRAFREHYKQWLYTAITRAAQEVKVF